MFEVLNIIGVNINKQGPLPSFFFGMTEEQQLTGQLVSSES